MMDVVHFVASEYKLGKIELDKYSHDMDASVKLLSEKDLILQDMNKMFDYFQELEGYLRFLKRPEALELREVLCQNMDNIGVRCFYFERILNAVEKYITEVSKLPVI